MITTEGFPASVEAWAKELSLLHPAEDAALLGQRQFPGVLAPALLVGLGLADHLLLPLPQRLELIADPGQLLDGQLLLGVAAGLLEVLLRLLQVRERLLLVPVGLVALILFHVALRLAHPPQCQQSLAQIEMGGPLARMNRNRRPVFVHRPRRVILPQIRVGEV